jgi:catechol 2,3-dioxygenase-like lactoylglutathione lyase family enzyme
MLGYVTIGARDSEASGRFYDAVFAAIGGERKSTDEGWIFYGPKGSDGVVGVCSPPFDKKPATVGNGMMIAFKAASKDEVTAAHAAALAHDGSDEGAPGFRPAEATSGFFGAYMRDPTGNKLCVYCLA